jgi:hypothetical protein
MIVDSRAEVARLAMPDSVEFKALEISSTATSTLLEARAERNLK